MGYRNDAVEELRQILDTRSYAKAERGLTVIAFDNAVVNLSLDMEKRPAWKPSPEPPTPRRQQPR